MILESNEKKYVNKSLDKALVVIDLFSYGDQEFSISEIAEKLDIHPGSLYPTLHTLEKHGYIRRDNHKKYKLGLKFLGKGSLVLDGLELRYQAREELRNLRDETNETIHLGVLDETEIVYIDKYNPERTVQMTSSIGKRVPFHCTALGKAITSYLKDEDRERIIQIRGLPQFTPNTITSVQEFRKELTKVKQKGFAIDDREHEQEVKCVASPIFNHRGEVIAAVSISGPALRITDKKLESFIPTIRKGAKRISKKLGWHE